MTKNPGDRSQSQDLWMVYVTFETPDRARAVMRDLLAQKLIACANILPAHEALYEWQGAVQESRECAVIMKTAGDRLDAVKEAVAAAHDYEVPCTVAWRIEAGHEPFLNWIATQTHP